MGEPIRIMGGGDNEHIQAQVLKLLINDALAVAIVDALGNQVDLCSDKGSLSNRSLTAIGNSVAVAVSLTSGKTSMIIQNTGTKTVYVGGSGVTASSYAFKLVPTQFLDFGKVKDGFGFYAICGGSDTSTIGVGEYA